jgi:galactose mutarotase-like enzyme
MFTIESSRLKVTIQAKGAELFSIFHQEHQVEYLWNADKAYWAKRSPVLFPIVGTLKNNTYFYKGKPYHLSRHGFARDRDFEVTAQSTHSLTFTISSDEDTLKVYPFPFQFSLIYTVKEEELSVTYSVHNKGSEDLYFSAGGHPAFKVPLTDGATYEDYELLFDKIENAGRWPINKEGLIEKEPVPFFNDTAHLPLSKELFKNDALVFKHLKSGSVQLQSKKAAHGLRFDFSRFPYLGLWAAPGADFVCIEPWCGIADSVESNQQLQDKEGIIPLGAGETFEATWTVQFY